MLQPQVFNTEDKHIMWLVPRHPWGFLQEDQCFVFGGHWFLWDFVISQLCSCSQQRGEDCVSEMHRTIAVMLPWPVSGVLSNR